MRLNFRPLISASLLFLSNTAVFATADFYGVKMTSEYHAKDLVVDESGPGPKFSVDKPGMDKRISATARLSGRQVKIEVLNRSDEVIHSEHDYAETIVVTRDGERHVLKPGSMAWFSSDTIAPNKSASFEPSFLGRALKKNEIRAIICSFDLGEMKIILLPLTDKSPVVNKKPASKPPAVKPPVKGAPKPAPKKVEDKKPAPKQVAADVKKTKESPKPVSAPKKTETPQPKIVKDTSSEEKKLLDQYERSRKSRKYWHVEELREGFVVINLGADDGLKPGSSVQIARDGAFLAQATVRQSSQGYATASLPPDAAVKEGDDVLFFDTTA